VQRSGEELCEGHYARPAGAAKCNSSKECHWDTLTCEVGSCGAQCVGLVGDAISRRTTRWAVDTTGTSMLANMGTSG
jgi:hypothetical protein